MSNNAKNLNCQLGNSEYQQSYNIDSCSRCQQNYSLSHSLISQRNALIPDASTVYCVILSWSHHRFIIITHIRDHTLVAARMLIDADALPVAQQALVKVVDGAGLLRQQRL